MASDNRDWYRDWWRKRTGYKENATFRLGHQEQEHRRYRAAWARNFKAVFFLVLFFVLIWALLKVAGR